MDVVVHQHVGMQVHASCLECFAKKREVAQAVAVVQEAWQPVVAALHDVLRNTGQVQTGKAGHGPSLALSGARGADNRGMRAWDDPG
ncbi:hypothetical protein [uncultured Luteimonas sp.]|uniref:hypothetical protein n=1 Tax=uncultured Luteimonas sp. TaxID=453144 RepID=UPI002619706E|nr:hypothetical protein [uncultured Luteimonas sp.]